MEKEVWKEIEGYEGLYWVSTHGRVKNNRKIKYISTNKNSKAKTVMLSKNAVKKFYHVHRLVGLAFVSNPENLPEINHKDEDRTNNYYKNLEWCTRKYNMSYGTLIERRSEKTRKPLVMKSTEGEVVKTFDSFTHAFKNGFNPSPIRRNIKGETKTYRGHIWSLAEKSKDENNQKLHY